MGGSISVKSIFGKGSTFSVILPLQKDRDSIFETEIQTQIPTKEDFLKVKTVKILLFFIII